MSENSFEILKALKDAEKVSHMKFLKCVGNVNTSNDWGLVDNIEGDLYLFNEATGAFMQVEKAEDIIKHMIKRESLDYNELRLVKNAS